MTPAIVRGFRKPVMVEHSAFPFHSGKG
jgi:hypothetical protein